MAYEVISQNNTTTTLSDGVNTIVIPSRVVLATSTSYTITKVNNNTATLEDGNGKIYRDIPCVAVLYGGGASGDPHNLGWYATESALTTAYPTAEAGDFAIVGSTDTVWVWDTDTSAWVDTDTKGQVQSVNNKTGTVVLDAFDVDATAQFETMPTANQGNSGKVVQYVGTTTASYTHGYIYENKETISYTDSVEFNPASISGTTVTATAGALAGLCAEYGSGNITDIIKGTLTYDLAGGLLVFVGLDDTDTQVCSFQLYTQDYEDAGFTFTGTLQDGDVIAFTCTISEVASYAWERIDVQPTPEALPDQTGQNGKFLTTNGTTASWGTVESLPSQTGNSGKFLTTNGTDASWSDKPLVNTATGTNSLSILGNPVSDIASIAIGYTSMCTTNYSLALGYNCMSNGVAIGQNCNATSTYPGKAVAIGSQCNANNGVAIGGGGNMGATNGIIMCCQTHNGYYAVNTGCFNIGNANGNFEIMSADGTIPADRTSPITSISTATVTQALAANTIYNCTVDMTSIEITLPATPTANFCAQLNFTSGSTPTAFTSPVGMVWLGDDVSTTFVPVANKRYAIMVFFDGVSTRGIVQAA